MYSGKLAFTVGPSSNRFTLGDTVRKGASSNRPRLGERVTTRRGFVPYAETLSPQSVGGERLAIVRSPANRPRHMVDASEPEFIPLNRGFGRFA